MFHGIDYPDENRTKEDGSPSQNFDVRFWNCCMRDGIIAFPDPNDTSLKRRTVFEHHSLLRVCVGKNLLSAESGW